jgi:predicted phosphohydrolase
MDFEPPDAFKPILRSAADDRLIRRYWRHSDGNRERLFFGLLRGSMEGIVTDDMLPDEIRRNHVRQCIRIAQTDDVGRRVTQPGYPPSGRPGSKGVRSVASGAIAGPSSKRQAGFVLAHLSDPHVPTRLAATPTAMFNKRVFGYLSWRLRRVRIHRAEVLDALVRDLMRAGPDHVAVTGDIVNISLPTEFARTALWLRTLGAPSDVTVVPGNHDAYVSVSWHQSWAAWRAFMTNDPVEARLAASPDHDPFPIVRRRGPVALIGLSTALPTAPGRSSGKVGRRQLERLTSCLATAASAKLFRVVLLHHPPMADDAPEHKRLTDAGDFRDVIARAGAELILHGHEHRFRFSELCGPCGPVPVFGVPSASMFPRSARAEAGQYHLYRIERRGEHWIIEMHIRAYRADLGQFIESGRKQLVLDRAPTSHGFPPHSTATTVLW